jgi:hypothetical protein
MTTYRLAQISASCWNITEGRKKVGFVNNCPKGFVARIGQHCEIGATAKEAFDMVACKALGFTSPGALVQYNSAVRARNAEARSVAHHAVEQALYHKNFDAIFDLITGIK